MSGDGGSERRGRYCSRWGGALRWQRGRWPALLAVAALLGACASAPRNDLPYPRITPDALAAAPDAPLQGQPMEWGGRILEVDNRPDRTLLTVLAFPLEADGWPDRHGPPQGRFIAERRGFLDPAVFAPGRLVTVRGPLRGYRDGHIGSRPYRYPVLGARHLSLWNEEAPQRGRGHRPDVSVGVGANNHGAGVGVGFGLRF